MSAYWLQVVRRSITPTTALLILLGQALPTRGQEAKPVPVTVPQIKPNPTPSASPLSANKEEPQILVGEVLIKGADQALQDEVYAVIKTQPGRTTSRSQLQEDINAIFATGYFSNVKAVPEDTPLGVRVTFEVQVNPVLQAVKVEGNRVLPEAILTKSFSEQYGKVLNLNRLQDGIKKVNEWYQKNGYVLAQVLDSPAVSPEGIVTLQVAEGEVEGVRVRFINKEGDDKDAKGNPIRGRTRDFIVTNQFQTKPGDIFNLTIIEQDLKRAFGLGIFEDVRLSLQPSETDPRKVVVVANVAELTEAESLFNLASRLEDEKSNNSKQKAIATYQELLRLHRQAKDQPNAAIVLNRMGSVFYDLEDYPKALDFYKQSLLLAKAINLPALEVVALNNIGNTQYKQEKYSQALDVYSQALPISQSLKSSSAKNIGTGFLFSVGQSSKRGRFSDFSIRPTRLTSAVPDLDITVYAKPLILLRLGELYQLLGEYQQALYSFKSALLQWEAVAGKAKDKDKDSLMLYGFFKAFNLAFLASLYADLGEDAQAATYRDEATQFSLKFSKTLREQAGDSDQANQISSLLQVVFSDFAVNIDGAKQATFENWMQQFVEVFPKADSKNGSTAFFLIFVGDGYAERGDDAQALKVYERALNAVKNSTNVDTLSLSTQVGALNGMAKVYGKGTAQQKAIGLHQQAIKVLQAKVLQASDQSIKGSSLHSGLLPETLNLLGKAYFRDRQFSQARKVYTQAIATDTTAKDPLKVAASRLGIAEIERALGNLAQAQTQSEAALTALETRPQKSSIQPIFSSKPYVDNAEGQPVVSTDPATGRLTEIGIRAAAPSASIRLGDAGDFNAYKDQAAFLASKKSYYQFHVDLLMQRYQQTGDNQYETEAFLTSERFQAQSLRAMLGQRDRPKDSNSTLAATASLPAIQANLDDDTILLEFSLGEQRSYLWAVTKNNISSYVLPPRSQIDFATRLFYNYLTNPNLRVRPNSTAQTGMNLSQLILGAVAPKLVGKKRLLVVSDGGLQYIPFSALPMPLAGVNSSTPNLASPNFADIAEPLLVRHEVVNLPSASTLLAIRQNRAKRIVPTKTLAVLADPIFGQDDKRLGAAQTKQLLAGNADGEQFYPRLPGTQRQAEQILALVPETQRSQKFGFDASRQAALSPELGDYKIVHFATHGILDGQRPERSGMILSTVNERGELQRSLLSPPDIFNTLKLSADLVVLNGCRTGLGTRANKEYSDRQNTYDVGIGFRSISATAQKNLTFNGEGVVGLTGSFLYAGAERVVASLWSVEEKATTDLMVRFYQNMLNGHGGKKLSPAAALREAQLSMWKKRRWESPYDWAGFVLQGEWR